jgi:protein ImuB
MTGETRAVTRAAREAAGQVPLPRLLLVECPGLDASGADGGGEHLRRFGRVVEALSSVCPWVDAVRPGVCILPIKGPARYFGSEDAVLARVAEAVAGALPAAEADDLCKGDRVRLGVAEGVFAAALAARSGAVVPAGETARFLAPWPVDELSDPELADVLIRLGLTTLGRFAALPVADVLARFGTSGVRGHRLARALDGELPGYRVTGMSARLVAALGRALALQDRQPGFWGGVSAADERAAEVLTALQRRLGTAAVTVPVLQGGRGPADRCRMVPWSPAAASLAYAPFPGQKSPRRNRKPSSEPPWPGRLPPPAPARVMAGDRSADLVDGAGVPVVVSGRGLLTAEPARLSVGGGPWIAVTAWSAPWPVEERWWSTARRRAARLQVLSSDGTARLLVSERGCWRVEAVYD